jgi:hypothetical protein
MNPVELTDKVLADVAGERGYQQARWDQEVNDDNYSVADWGALIDHYIDIAIHESLDGEDYRERFIQIAALAVAAVEALDRKANN